MPRDLPIELLFMIIAECEGNQLTSLIRVASNLRPFAERTRYRRIHVSTYIPVIKFLRAITARPQLALYVHSFQGPPFHIETFVAYPNLVGNALALMSNLVEMDIPNVRMSKHVVNKCVARGLRTIRLRDVLWIHIAEWAQKQKNLDQVWFERLDHSTDATWEHIISHHPRSNWLRASPIPESVRQVVVPPVLGGIFLNLQSTSLESITFDLGVDPTRFMYAARSTLEGLVEEGMCDIKTIRFILPLTKVGDFPHKTTLLEVLLLPPHLKSLEFTITKLEDDVYTEFLQRLQDILPQLKTLLHVHISIPAPDPPTSEILFPIVITHGGPSSVRRICFCVHDVHAPSQTRGFSRHLSPACGCPRLMATKFQGTWYYDRKKIDVEWRTIRDDDEGNEEEEEEEEEEHAVELMRLRKSNDIEMDLLLKDERECAYLIDWQEC